MKRSFEERFWEKVAIGGPDDCWEWQAGINSQTGYGHLNIADGTTRQGYSHRVAYTLTNGPIPDGLWILHSCHNRKCVNPAHLRAGTPKENTQDMMNSGRHRYGNGIHPVPINKDRGEWRYTPRGKAPITRTKLQHARRRRSDEAINDGINISPTDTIVVNIRLIRTRLHEKNLTLQSLAKLAEVSDLTMRHIMYGDNCLITTLAAIARVLDIDASELLIVNGHTETEAIPA